jgi:putative membrane protein
MRGLLLRWLINGVALYVAVRLVPGIHAQDEVAIIWVALILGLVNALIRPIVAFLTCPLIILSLGLFTLVINTFMLGFSGWLAERLGIGFTIDGFWPAFFGALVVSLVSMVLTMLIKGEGKDYL